MAFSEAKAMKDALDCAVQKSDPAVLLSTLHKLQSLSVNKQILSVLSPYNIH